MQTVLATLLRELLKQLDQETVKEIVDSVLDKVEEKIAASPNKWDDAVVQPIIDATRNILGINDKDYGSDKQ